MTYVGKVFMSYSHNDAWDFTRRLAFALSMYPDHFDVFWDNKTLEHENLYIQLKNEVESSDYFLYIMSPKSKESDWCQRELTYAKDFGIKILPIIPTYPANYFYIDKEYIDEELFVDDGDLYYDFSKGGDLRVFDAAFRNLTAKLCGQPFSSWEAYPNLSNNDLLQALEKGFIPGLIAREISEWLITEYIWDIVRTPIESEVKFVATPRTANGMLVACQYIQKQLIDHHTRNFLNLKDIHNIIKVIESFAQQLLSANDESNKELGKLATEIIQTTGELLQSRELRKRNFLAYAHKIEFFRFDVAEKLREYINVHARRSRYLY